RRGPGFNLEYLGGSNILMEKDIAVVGFVVREIISNLNAKGISLISVRDQKSFIVECLLIKGKTL
ncbi:hypothetical protein ACQP3C_28590, partial [Escherichia coli]